MSLEARFGLVLRLRLSFNLKLKLKLRLKNNLNSTSNCLEDSCMTLIKDPNQHWQLIQDGHRNSTDTGL